MADQIDNLILNTETSEQNLKRLTRELAQTEDKIAALQATFQAGGISFEKFDQQLEALSDRAQGFRGALASLDSGTARTAESHARLTSSITTLSYSLNDAQQFAFGFRQGIVAISNNIPGLVRAGQELAQVGIAGVTTALAGPAGLILALTAVTSAIPLLSVAWSKLEDAWSGGGAKDRAKEMDELAKATSRTADQTERLVRYRREQAVGRTLEESRPKAEVEAQQALERAVPELPGGYAGLRDALVAARNPQGLQGRYSEQDRQLLEDARSVARLIPTQANIGAARQTERDVEERVRQRERDRAAEDIRRQIADPNQLVGLLNELRRAGRGDLATPLEAAVGAKGGRAGARSAEDEAKIAFDLQKAIQEVEQGDLKKRQKAAEEDARINFELQEAIADVEQGDLKKRKAAAEQEAKIQFDLQKAIQEVEAGDRKKRLEEAKKGGADLLAGTAARAGGGTEQVRRLLQSFGLDEETAGALAGEAVQGQRRGQLQQLLQEKPRNVEVYGTADYLSRVQTAVGGERDFAQRQLQEQIAMNQKLGVIAENTRALGLAGDGTFP